MSEREQSPSIHTPAVPAVAPPSVPAVGQLLRERYMLEARIGGSDERPVFKALDRLRSTLPATDRHVALKVLHASGPCPAETLANLSLEFHCAQVLSHRNILNVYELDRDGEVVFATMELLEGEPLSGVLERLHPAAMIQSQAWPLIRQLGAGLAHAHERGVVHGELEPRNIFITRDGELRILGFGAASRAEPPQPHPQDAHAAIGSRRLPYASCEQLEGRRADPRDDLYAFACISYELLAGSHPFGSRTATLARNYRVGLVRPAGLTGRQWRALQKGLSWHRGGRSIGVRAWMHRLIRQGTAAQPLTPLRELSQPKHVPSSLPRQAAALFLFAALTAVAVLAGYRSTFARKSIDAPAPSAAANRLPDPFPSHEPAIESQPTRAAEPAKKDAADASSRPRPASKAAPVALSVEPSPVRSDDHFAEIRLSRNHLKKDSSFTWWTEPATAKPNVDYVPEAVAVQSFPAGFRGTRLYVRLLPQSLRSQRSYFYIAIARTGPHRTAANVIRRQIWLPASANLQAQR